MDPSSEIEELRARIERLERMAGLAPAPKPQPVAETPVSPEPIVVALAEPAAIAPPPSPPPLPQPPPLPGSPQRSLATSEAWLARIGIGLLVIGLLFFLKLSLDRGWITPLLQLVVAASACGALVVWGEILSRTRPPMGNLAFGGGVAGLIGVIAAGQYLYHLYDGAVSCGLTIAVTAGCLVQSLRKDSSVLCVLAVLGAMVSPFFLGLQSPWVYALHALAAAALALGVFFMRGWRGVLVTGSAGAWLLMLTASIGARSLGLRNDEMVIQAAAIVLWLAFWLTPVVRVLMRDVDEMAQRTAVWLGAILPALSGVLFTAIIWEGLSTRALGALALGFALLTGGLGLALKQKKPLTASAQFIAAAVFGGMSIPLLLDGAACWIVFAVFAAALQGGTRWSTDRPLLMVANLASLVCFAMVVVFCFHLGTTARWSADKVISVVFLIGSLTATARLAKGPAMAGLYGSLTHISIVGLILAGAAADILPVALAPLGIALVALVAWFGLVSGRNEASEITAHVLLAIATPFALGRLVLSPEATVWLNRPAASMLALLAAGLVIGLQNPTQAVRCAYLWIAHLLWLILLWSQFREVAGGGMVSVSWAVYAVILMIAGVWRNSSQVRAAGIFCLVLLLARLFVVDLALLDLATKTLIFIGIGLLLFGAGYFLPRFLPRKSDEA